MIDETSATKDADHVKRVLTKIQQLTEHGERVDALLLATREFRATGYAAFAGSAEILLSQMGQDANLLPHVVALSEEGPDDYLGIFASGVKLYHTHHYQDALVAFDRYLRLTGESVMAQMHRAKIFEQLAQFDEALSVYDHIRGADTWLPEQFHACRGNLLFMLQRYEEAQRDLVLDISRHPYHLQSLRAVTQSLIALRRFDMAGIYVDRLLLIKPADVSAIIMKGAILYAQRYYKQAEKQFQLAVDLMPDNTSLQEALQAVRQRQHSFMATFELWFRSVIRSI